jgi:hypothetical protein
MNRPKWRALTLAPLAIGLVALAALAGGDAMAQSPAPNAYFLDWAPGNHTSTTNGLQVEGLGGINCSYSQSSVESATVYDLNTRRQATITEISPQSVCGSISQYESLVNNITNYVEHYAATHTANLWGGFMLDEEPGFGFSYSQLVTLNTYTANRLVSTPGITWWYENQGNCSGCWTQAQYDNLTYYPGKYSGNAAPQVYNNFMRDQANSSGFNDQLINCWSGAPYPYDVGCTVGFYPHTNGSYAAASIAGNPYNQQFGTSIHFQWENKFQGQ